jgi:DUF1680 family protein
MNTASGQDYPFKPVAFTEVQVDDAFWGPRLKTNREVTLWYDFQKCEETGRIKNFEVAGKLKEGGFEGIFYNDSDVYKVIEGAAYMLSRNPDPKLDQYLDDLIAKIAAAQEEDGYLYTARTINDPNYRYGGSKERWADLKDGHELYNVGHMYEAAVAHWQATGKRSLLEVAIRNADLICKVFGEKPGQLFGVPGHEEIEIGLVKLYNALGDPKYLEQAKFFVDMRGRNDQRTTWGTYYQDHAPLLEQEEAVGHAVRGGYLYAGMADIAALTGDTQYTKVIDRIWEDVVNRKLYLTGNVGQHGHGEGYAGAYTLPNLTAYNETCAAIALAMWNHRMFLLKGDAKYIDVLERILYNGFLAGVSLSGDRFFYPNPLACDMHFKCNHGAFERSPWFGTSCCPVNVVRFLPSIAGYVYAHQQDSLYVNLYIGGEAAVALPGNTIKIDQKTDYPWNGNVQLTIAPEKPGDFSLCLRIPGWLEGRPIPGDLYRYQQSPDSSYRITVNGTPVTPILRQGYAVLDRRWTSGDVVRLEMDLSVQRVTCNDKVEANRGRVAIERGPIVYCIEGEDHSEQVMNLFMPDKTLWHIEHRKDLLGGVTLVSGQGQAAYRDSNDTVQSKPATLNFIPYYAWCERGANEMQVWLPQSLENTSIPPLPTVASKSKASASHCWQHDSITAIKDLQEPQRSSDPIPRLTFWDHKGTAEWLQYDFDSPTEVSSVHIYWFDDTGQGHCRVPKSWQLMYRQNHQWKKVQTTKPYGTTPDKYNPLSFNPVTTDALRIEVQLQEGYSAGVLEWKVNN